MAEEISLEIVTLERTVFSGSVSEVSFVGEQGELDVLPGHIPLMTLVHPGEVICVTSSGAERYAAGSGFAEIVNNRVTLLVSAAEPLEAIDLDRARIAAEDASKRLSSAETLDEAEVAEQTERLARAQARVKVASRADAGSR